MAITQIKRHLVLPVLLIALVSYNACNHQIDQQVTWTLEFHKPDGSEIVVAELSDHLSKEWAFKRTIEDINFEVTLSPLENFTRFKATATPNNTEVKGYFSVVAEYRKATPYNFNGEVLEPEIYRQCPHDTNAWIVTTIAEQAVPVIALKTPDGFQVGVSNSPYHYDNFTSQAFYPDTKRILLSSGDNGAHPGLHPDTAKQISLDYNADKTQRFAPGKVEPYFHRITPNHPHVFDGIIFKTSANDLNGLRKSVNENIAKCFSQANYTDYFGSLAFTTAYMNLRTNDSGKSNLWVVPSVEYGNTQYGRDAFWISMMLSPEQGDECLKNELSYVNEFAEYPLFAVLWSYRSYTSNIPIDLAKVQAYVDAIEKRARDNYYYSYSESDGRLDFQYWGDLMAFEKNDVVSYNQGLFSLAIKAARLMGLKVKSDPALATDHYLNMFNPELKFLPLSKMKKDILGPDPVLPDLLSQVFFHEKMLSPEIVRNHFDRMVKYSKTEYGFKIVATANGDYLPASAYDIPGYVSQVNREKIPDGRYFRGGSYFLYDNLFLIDAHLHGIKEAEELLLWRVGLDFTIGNTTYETLNTVSGEPWKPNMGWNVAVYAIWRKLMDEGKASDRLFRYVDSIAMNNTKHPANSN